MQEGGCSAQPLQGQGIWSKDPVCSRPHLGWAQAWKGPAVSSQMEGEFHLQAPIVLLMSCKRKCTLLLWSSQHAKTQSDWHEWLSCMQCTYMTGLLALITTFMNVLLASTQKPKRGICPLYGMLPQDDSVAIASTNSTDSWEFCMCNVGLWARPRWLDSRKQSEDQQCSGNMGESMSGTLYIGIEGGYHIILRALPCTSQWCRNTSKSNQMGASSWHAQEALLTLFCTSCLH